MDPNATWQELADAFVDDDKERCAELATNLVDWLGRGGFPPTVTRHQDFDRVVVRTFCESVIAYETD